jgi:hypothetical protein
LIAIPPVATTMAIHFLRTATNGVQSSFLRTATNGVQSSIYVVYLKGSA